MTYNFENIHVLLDMAASIITVWLGVRWLWRKAGKPLADIADLKTSVAKLETGQERIFKALKLRPGHAQGD